MKPRPSAVHLLQRASLLLADSVEKVCDITGRQRGNAGKWVDVAYWHFCDIGVEQRNVRFSNRPSGVKRFQTIHHLSVNVARGLVLLFGIGTKALPSWDSKTRWNNLSGGLAVSLTGGQADMRTHLIHRPARDIIPPLGGARVSSYCI